MRDKFADHVEILDDDNNSGDLSGSSPTFRASKAWRTIERYREMKELRKQLEDILLEDTSGINFNDLNL